MAEKIPVYQLEDLGEQISPVALFNFSYPPIRSYAGKVSQPHRHDHYCCFYIEQGQMDFQVDFQPLQVRDKSILVSYPGQVHQSDPSQDCVGWLLIFDAKMVNEAAKMTIEGPDKSAALIVLDDRENEWFKQLFELMQPVVYDRSGSVLNSQLTRSLLDCFIFRICMLRESQDETHRKLHSSRSIDITNRFRHLLKQHFKTAKRPVDYAGKMHFSVSYLNDTVRNVTGFPLTYFIQQEIIGEAQRLLYYSDLSVREIAYELGYEDDKYFIRLFGKVTGMSPSTFRKSRKQEGQSSGLPWHKI